MMRKILYYAFTLILIYFVSVTFFERFSYLRGKKILALAQAAQEENNFSGLIPGAVNFSAVKSTRGEIIYYKAYSQDNKFLGVVFIAQGRGYCSDIRTLAGMTKDGVITAIRVISQKETRGLGEKLMKPAFTSLFSNKDIESLSGIQAITGATVSSRAVIDSVKLKAQEIKALISGES